MCACTEFSASAQTYRSIAQSEQCHVTLYRMMTHFFNNPEFLERSLALLRVLTKVSLCWCMYLCVCVCVDVREGESHGYT